METVFLGLIVILLSVAGLAAGLFFGRAPIKGSCGGLSCISKLECSVCPRRRDGAAP